MSRWLSLGTTMIAVLLLLPAAMYGSVVYSYTGNGYTAFPDGAAGYTGSNHITGALIVSDPLQANQSYAWGLGGLEGTPTATDTFLGGFISDGTITYSGPFGANPGDQIGNIFITTDASGNISQWYFGFCLIDCTANPNLFTTSGIPSFGGVSVDATQASVNAPFDQWFGYNTDAPGTWSAGVVPTPEPSSLMMLGSGMVGLLGVMRKRLRL